MNLFLAWLVANVLLGALLLTRFAPLVRKAMFIAGATVSGVIHVVPFIASLALRRLGLASAS